jgi:ATP-dependent Lhr-like helicase
MLNEGEAEDLVYAHHGSLAREIRLAVEEKLKNGELRAIVATILLSSGSISAPLTR